MSARLPFPIVETPNFVAMKTCDPAVLGIKGIQARGDSIEDGNHVRAFIGVEYGFPKKGLSLYRRLKRQRPIPRSFLIPKTLYRRRDRKFSLPTNDQHFRLDSSVREDLNKIILDISFPHVVGYFVFSKEEEDFSSVAVEAFYRNTPVAKKKGGKGLDFINAPFDHLRMYYPMEMEFHCDFILMYEDANDKNWELVETLPSTHSLLQEVEENGLDHTFQSLVSKRFWPDVRNRYLMQGSLKELYGGGAFQELHEAMKESYTYFSFVEMVRGQRIEFYQRGYDPEWLSLLILLSLDVNIATLLGLHTVDRGQSPEMPYRSNDPVFLKEWVQKNWKTPFDYKFEGKWDHLSSLVAAVYYHQTSPRVTGKKITAIEEVGYSGLEGMTRFYKVGLRWEHEQNHFQPLIVGYDIYRNGALLTSKPHTPAHPPEVSQDTSAREKRSIHSSLPPLHPFLRRDQPQPLPFHFLDPKVGEGKYVYHVEAVDVFGRVSKSQWERPYQLEAIPPLPPPRDLKALPCSREESDQIQVQFQFSHEERKLAPDFTSFELFFHDQAPRGENGWLEPSDWRFGPVRVSKPDPYPFTSTGSVKRALLFALQPPLRSSPLPQDSSAVLFSQDMVIGPHSSILGGVIELKRGNQTLEQGAIQGYTRGKDPSFILSYFEPSEEELNANRGVLSMEEIQISSFQVLGRNQDVGQTSYRIQFSASFPLREWRLGSWRVNVDWQSSNVSTLSFPQMLYFPIVEWKKVADGIYDFTLAHIQGQEKGEEENREYEIVPGTQLDKLVFPGLIVATFPTSFLVEGEIGYVKEGKQCFSAVVAMAKIEGALSAAFYPAFDAVKGFVYPDHPVHLYPSFHYRGILPFVDEAYLDTGRPIFVAARTVIHEGGREKFSSLTPPIRVVLDEKIRQPDPPQLPVVEGIECIYARPMTKGAVVSLSWTSSAHAFKIYRIPESFSQIINDFESVKRVAVLCNRGELTTPSFTDSFEGLTGGKYYYKVVALNEAGVESAWEQSPIFPAYGIPVCVLNRTPPAIPSIQKLTVDQGKVCLEWQGNPNVQGYRIEREGISFEYLVDEFEKVPLKFGLEKKEIKTKTDQLDLFWMPSFSDLHGVFTKEGATRVNDLSQVPNQPLMIEYFTESIVRLPSTYLVSDGAVELRVPAQITELIGIFEMENFHREDLSNPLPGELDLSGPSPLIRNVDLPDESRPVIAYRKEGNVETHFFYGSFSVRNQTIALLSGPDLPLIQGASVTNHVILPTRYGNPQESVVGVYEQSDYQIDPEAATNLYQGTFDGLSISNISLENDTEVVITAKQLTLHRIDYFTYYSLPIPAATAIEGVATRDNPTESFLQGNTRWRFSNGVLQVHEEVNPPLETPLIVRYLNANGEVQEIDAKGRMLRFEDPAPPLDVAIEYSIQAVKILNYTIENIPKTLKIYSEKSPSRKVEIHNPLPPVPPELSYSVHNNVLSWETIEGIVEYQLERKASESPIWVADGVPLHPGDPMQKENPDPDQYYRLRVRGANKKSNVVFKEWHFEP